MFNTNTHQYSKAGDPIAIAVAEREPASAAEEEAWNAWVWSRASEIRDARVKEPTVRTLVHRERVDEE